MSKYETNVPRAMMNPSSKNETRCDSSFPFIVIKPLLICKTRFQELLFWTPLIEFD